MKYTTKVKQIQLVGGVQITPAGGELTKEQVEAIIADPYGKDLIQKGYLSIDGVKPEDLEKKKGKPAGAQAPKPSAPAAPAPAGSAPAASDSGKGSSGK